MSQSPLSKCPFEHIKDPALEAQQIAETSAITVKLLDKRYPPPEPILRGVHPKAHGCVSAFFTVNNDLPPELQVGLFATPGKSYDAVIRFSNADAVIHKPDLNDAGEHGSRGMAIKVYAVDGEVLEQDHGANNQDFLMINQPVFAFANMCDYLRLDRVLDQDNDVPDRFFSPLSLNNPKLTEAQKQGIQAYIEAENITQEDLARILDTFNIVGEIKHPKLRPPVSNPLGAQYFSAAPFLFGPDRVMKFSARPLAEVPPLDVPPAPSENYLREALTATMQENGNIEFEFMLQVRDKFTNLDFEIENASSEWNEREFPFISVAKISIPCPQADVNTETARAHCENLVFNPWHALVEHQPIGSINRLRRAVYQASAEHRLGEDTPSMPFFIRWLEKLIKFLFG